jgi:hypothetical protein
MRRPGYLPHGNTGQDTVTRVRLRNRAWLAPTSASSWVRVAADAR